MVNHRQEVIDSFVRSVIPTIIFEENRWEDSGIFDNKDAIVKDAYSLAGKLFEKHAETCKVCNKLTIKTLFLKVKKLLPKVLFFRKLSGGKD